MLYPWYSFVLRYRDDIFLVFYLVQCLPYPELCNFRLISISGLLSFSHDFNYALLMTEKSQSLEKLITIILYEMDNNNETIPS